MRRPTPPWLVTLRARLRAASRLPGTRVGFQTPRLATPDEEEYLTREAERLSSR